jgi:protein-S-isoprenylcysteine O-methyltransferase Ste14
MVTGIYQAGIILLVVISYYLMDFLLISRFDRQRQAEGSGRSWDYTLMILAALAVIILQPVLLPALSLTTIAAWGLVLQLVGIALVLGGLGLHAWSRVHLRQFYAERVEVQSEHSTVNTGPYRYVRHPVFTSFFMCILGLLFINPSLLLLLMAGYVFWDFSRAAKQEEELLSQNLPDYRDYMAQTPRFFPKLGSR